MHCAHVQLKKDTVNTCRLCLSQTRMRLKVETAGLLTRCMESDSRLQDDRDMLRNRLWRYCGRSRTTSCPRAWTCNRTVP